LRNAVIASLAIHIFVFSYFIIGERRGKADAYPKIMSVDLVSLPPMSKGTPDGAQQIGDMPKAKQRKIIPENPNNAHMTEVQKNKKPARQQTPEELEKANKKPGKSNLGAGMPEGVTYGSEFGNASLEGGSFETPTYINILFAKIKGRWDNPYQGGEKITCVIYFTIERAGNISDGTIEKSSGIAAFDQSALRAVLSASPPPLPIEFTGNQLGIHLEFQFLP
jgi:periplasmic protein TonB